MGHGAALTAIPALDIGGTHVSAGWISFDGQGWTAKRSRLWKLDSEGSAESIVGRPAMAGHY
jgi:hypothetical protein